MNGFVKCENGHFFNEKNFETCPYCSGTVLKKGTAADAEKTLQSTQAQDFNTIKNQDGDNTQIFNPNQKSGIADSAPIGVTHKHENFDHTFIQTPQNNTDSASKSTDEQPRASRKLVGWLVSFTLDPMGIDYRLFEGNNTVGRDVKNTIKILKDNTISGEHVQILFRNNRFYIKDKMSVNGTYINGNELEIDKAYELQDGDEVKMGNAIFKFKSAV